MTEKIEIVQLKNEKRYVGSEFGQALPKWQGQNERFLIVSPHDDDAAIGAGLVIQMARLEKVPVYILIVTDGSMGYCSSEQKQNIAEIRKKETFKCYKKLGVDEGNILWMNYPDCRLNEFGGRRLAEKSDGPAICGFTGLQNDFTYYLRKIRPTRCFVPTSNDLHPDHKIVYEEFLISLFHSATTLWPELGRPIDKPPGSFYELAVYCKFPGPPTLQIRTPAEYLEKKLAAVSEFQSQKQIGLVIERLRSNGPVEYLRDADLKIYQPADYQEMFKDTGEPE